MSESKLNFPYFDPKDVCSFKGDYVFTVYVVDDAKRLLHGPVFNSLSEAEEYAKEKAFRHPDKDIHVMKSYLVFKAKQMVTIERLPVA